MGGRGGTATGRQIELKGRPYSREGDMGLQGSGKGRIWKVVCH